MFPLFLTLICKTCPHPAPKSARVGEVGWGVPKLTHSNDKVLKSGHQIQVWITVTKTSCGVCSTWSNASSFLEAEAGCCTFSFLSHISWRSFDRLLKTDTPTFIRTLITLRPLPPPPLPRRLHHQGHILRSLMGLAQHIMNDHWLQWNLNGKPCTEKFIGIPNSDYIRPTGRSKSPL